VIEAHEGSVELRSSEGKGTTATVWIKRWREKEDEQRHAA
jgi:signal transduction histidine kinase